MDTPPEGAVETKAALVASATIGALLATVTSCAAFLLIALYALFAHFGTVTLTGWAVFLLLCIPLGLAFANSLQIARGAAWRIIPWIVWMIGAIILPVVLTFLRPYYYPLYIETPSEESDVRPANQFEGTPEARAQADRLMEGA